MNKIEIVLPRKVFIPGDVVDGKVVLSCYKPFKSRKGIFEIVGMLTYTYTELKVKGKGKLSTKKTEKSGILHQASSVFAENVEFDKGKHEYKFQFQLPDDIKPSYSGLAVTIVYSIGTSLEMSRLSKITDTTTIDILHPIMEYPDDAIEEADPEYAEKSIRIRMNSQKHNIGESINFDYRVETDEKFKLLRVEIEHAENSDRDRKKILLKREIPSEEITHHKWNKIVVRSSNKFPPTITSGEMKSKLTLKVTIVKNLAVNKTVKIPLVAGHDLKPGWKESMGTSVGRTKITPEMTRLVKPSEQHLSDGERMAQNWYNRAVTYRDNGAVEEAILSVEKALKWAPDSEQALALHEELKHQKEEKA